MGEGLIELEQPLRNKEGNFTSQEANVYMQLRAYCVRDFTLGLSGGALVTWLASRKLPNLLRLSLTAGVGYVSGMWRFRKAADNCLQHILSMEGTRMQRELGTLLLEKYQDDPLVMQRVSKFFYSEEVYNDASNKPRLRWRYRNFFTDMYDENSDQKRTTLKKPEKADDQKGVVALKKINWNRKQEQMNAVVDATENPFDCIFGLPGSADEIPHSDTSIKSASGAARGNKRSHRRHRRHHQEAADHP